MSANLPPMANVFAVLAADPQQAENLRERVGGCDEFEPWATTTEWVVGVAPLPDGPAEPPELSSHKLLFVEGRDRVIGSSQNGIGERAREVAALARDSPGTLGQLPGDFGFFCFDRDAVTVVRSCAGIVPIYLHRGAGGLLAVATRLDYFPRLLGREFALDPLVWAITLSGWVLNPDQRTYLREVSAVPRGSFARLERGRPPRIGCYWDPRPAAGTRLVPSSEHPAQLRELLLATLDRELDTDGRNLLGLSGGVDSSSVAALAAGVLGRRTATLSLLPPDAAGQRLELGFIDPICARYELGPNRRLPLALDTWLELVRGPNGQLIQLLHPNLLVLPELASELDIRVYFGGEAADEIVGSYEANLLDYYAQTSLRELLVSDRAAMPFGARNLRGWSRWRARRALGKVDLVCPSELPSYVRPELNAEYREWRDRRRRTAARDRRPLGVLAQLYEHDAWVAMNWEACSRLGIRRSLPFYTREVQELAFSCHPSELIGPGTKKLLRTALHADVPHHNLYRADKGAWTPLPKANSIDDPLPPTLAPIVIDRWLHEPPGQVESSVVLCVAGLVELDRRLASANGPPQPAAG